MDEPISFFIGLDVHKDTIAVALAGSGLRGEVREHGKIPNTPAALTSISQSRSDLPVEAVRYRAC